MPLQLYFDDHVPKLSILALCLFHSDYIQLSKWLHFLSLLKFYQINQNMAIHLKQLIVFGALPSKRSLPNSQINLYPKHHIIIFYLEP